MGDKRTASPTSVIPSHPAKEQGPPAIQVVNACKSYSNGVPVLKNFNMTVPAGTIYGLLGSSGCGKTTILSCIVGLRKLDTGDIWVYGARDIPGRRLGYMPQDIALYKHLSIKEMLQYFGRIYGMTHSEIISRIEFLTNFLALPDPTGIIGSLSGGQSRRTSLAACLLHEPSLLILDEPTVGVDPLLRETIWAYLSEMVEKKSTTVIVTTHYIEEASSKSHTVGLMRNGKLLVEKSPQALLAEHHCVMLDEIVLKLCRNDTTEFGESNHEEVRQALTENSFYSRRKNNFKPAIKAEREEEVAVRGLKFKQQNSIDENLNKNQKENETSQAQRRPLKRTMSIREQATQGIWGKYSRIRALAIRNSLTLLRSPLFMLAIFVMPSFQVIITNLTLGPEPKNLAFGIIDPEIHNDLSHCDSINMKKCETSALSCQYIKSLPNNIINPIAVTTKEQALSDVKTGKIWGYMSFPNNFSNHLIDRAAANIFADNETLDGSTITLQLDHSHYFAAALLTKSLYESFLVFVQNTLSNCEQDAHKADLPLHFTPIYGSLDITFHDYIAPAVLIVILFFIPYLSCSVYNITDRKQGTLDRSMVAGIKMTDLLSAFFVTEGFLIIVQTLIAYVLVLYIFQMEIKGSVVGFLLITILTGAAGLSLGFLIAQLVDEEVEALILGVGFYLPNLIFCGILWPLEAAPWWIRSISYCLPCTWAISGVRSIISRGWPLTHQYVLPAYAVLLTWIVCSWILASLAFRRRFK
ncbi:ABC transporter G family member 23 isoform X2 [Folsomia candida]|nr:ABC transporter G family member 23 isoform X2 [Folsomia candida]